MTKAYVRKPSAALVAKANKFLKRDKQPPRMTPDEKRLMRDCHFDQGEAPVDIATLFKRSLSAVCRLLAQKKAPKPVGRPAKLTEERIDKLVDLIENMVEKAEGSYEVTLPTIMKRAKLKFCEKTIANALHDRGYYFRPLRQKMVLTPADVKERFAFSKKYRKKPRSFWLKKIKGYFDNKHFKVATTAAGRKHLAQQKVRGCYRKKGKGLNPGHVKPSPKNHGSSGFAKKGALVMGGVGGGSVFVWHVIDDRWSGEVAASVVNTVMKPALKKKNPSAKSYLILEDNDPTGNRAKACMKAKRKANIRLFYIPKRSPDLNVLDYAIWSHVNLLMRRQERAWPKDKRETRDEFIKRLGSTARNLPRKFINDSIADMQSRCEKLYKAKGGLFEEGGKRKKRRTA